MVRNLSTLSSLAKVMVQTPLTQFGSFDGMLKFTVPPLVAFVIASRSEPAPLSPVLLTEMGGGGGGQPVKLQLGPLLPELTPPATLIAALPAWSFTSTSVIE